MKTPYSEENAEFSAKAHKRAVNEFYPKVFGKDAKITIYSPDEFNTPEDKVLDGLLGIDKRLKIESAGNGSRSFSYTIQERWRRLGNFFNPYKYIDYQDITITEWNHETDLPSELHKIVANLFVYGYYEEKLDKIVQGTVSYVTPLLMKIQLDSISFVSGRNFRSNQSFRGYPFSVLEKEGIMFYKYPDWDRGIVTPKTRPIGLDIDNLIRDMKENLEAKHANT